MVLQTVHRTANDQWVTCRRGSDRQRCHVLIHAPTDVHGWSGVAHAHPSVPCLQPPWDYGSDLTREFLEAVGYQQGKDLFVRRTSELKDLLFPNTQASGNPGARDKHNAITLTP